MKGFILVSIVIFTFLGCGGPKPDNNTVNDNDADLQSMKMAQSKQNTQPLSKNDYYDAGVKFLTEANVPEAVDSFTKGIQENPQDIRNYLALSETFIHLDEFEQAEGVLSIASKIAPDNGKVFYLFALNNHFLGNKEEAIQNAQKSVKLSQEAHDEENFKLALVLLQGLLNEAEKQ